MIVASMLYQLFTPTKINYEIHGNTIPHLHVHLFPRFAGDPHVGGPIDPRRASFKRSREDVERMRNALEVSKPSAERE